MSWVLPKRGVLRHVCESRQYVREGCRHVVSTLSVLGNAKSWFAGAVLEVSCWSPAGLLGSHGCVMVVICWWSLAVSWRSLGGLL